jgi:putative ABC transport system ATP-binding protein/lipoprotein-releasing system ATP-binding protein
MSLIELRSVTKTYAIDSAVINAVNNASIEIKKGQFVSIVGHSGSGKTTILSILGGIAKPTSGSVLYDGQDIYAFNSDKLSEYRSEKIGFMFQFASLLPILTSLENLLLPCVFKTVKESPEAREKKAKELLDMVGLRDKINAYPSQLSGGQQRRIAIARAFMNDPEVILADEPTGDLDEDTESEMMSFFKRMNSEKNITFIMVTHNTDLAMQTGRRLKMSGGIIAEL